MRHISTILTILAYAAIAFLALGLASIVYNLLSRRIIHARKPLYWLALPMIVAILVLFVDFLLRQQLGSGFLPPNSLRLTLTLVVLLLGLLLVLVPYVDRLEHAQVVRMIVTAQESEDDRSADGDA